MSLKPSKWNSHNLQLQLAKEEIKELKESLRFVEFYLAQSQQDVQALEAALQESESKCQKQQVTIEEYETQIDKLGLQLENSNENSLTVKKKLSDKDELIQKVKSEWQHEKKLWTEENQRLQRRVFMAEEEIQTLRKTNSALNQKLKLIAKESRVNIYPEVRKEMFDELKNLKVTLEYMRKLPQLSRQVEDLEDQNKNLHKVIKTAKELKNFNELMEDSEGLGYIGNLTSAKSLSMKDWVPLPVYEATKESTNLTKSPIINASVVSIIKKINESWLQRETKRLKRLKNSYEKKLEALRKKQSSTPISGKTTERKPPNKESLEEEIVQARGEVAEAIVEALQEYMNMKQDSSEDTKSEEWLLETLISLIDNYTEKLIFLCDLNRVT